MGIAQLFTALEEHVADRVGLALHRRDADGAAAAVVLGVAQRVVFQFAEVRQHVRKTPAVVAVGGPVIEVVGLAAHVDHGVDRARAALHFATRRVDFTPGQLLLWLAVVHPVEGRVVIHFGETDWDLEPPGTVLAAGFQQQHRVFARGGQPVGEDAACGASAGDDVVICHSRLPHSRFFSPWRAKCLLRQPGSAPFAGAGAHRYRACACAPRPCSVQPPGPVRWTG